MPADRAVAWMLPGLALSTLVLLAGRHRLDPVVTAGVLGTLWAAAVLVPSGPRARYAEEALAVLAGPTVQLVALGVALLAGAALFVRGDDGAWRSQLPAFVLLDQLIQRCCRKRVAAREQLVEDETKRVNVAARRHFAPEKLFGRHVRGRTGANVVNGSDRGESEIHQPHVAGIVEHHVGWLQITMHDSPVVRCS